MFKARIMVCGAGGGGSNTINRLSKMGVIGASLMAVNTDAKHLNGMDPSIKRILIGGALTRGLGAGGFPEIGAKAAEYSRSEIDSALRGCNLLFLTAGMGGGTGTGAAPVIADTGKEERRDSHRDNNIPVQAGKGKAAGCKKGIEELRRTAIRL